MLYYLTDFIFLSNNVEFQQNVIKQYIKKIFEIYLTDSYYDLY